MRTSCFEANHCCGRVVYKSRSDDSPELLTENLCQVTTSWTFLKKNCNREWSRAATTSRPGTRNPIFSERDIRTSMLLLQEGKIKTNDNKQRCLKNLNATHVTCLDTLAEQALGGNGVAAVIGKTATTWKNQSWLLLRLSLATIPTFKRK